LQQLMYCACEFGVDLTLCLDPVDRIALQPCFDSPLPEPGLPRQGALKVLSFSRKARRTSSRRISSRQGIAPRRLDRATEQTQGENAMAAIIAERELPKVVHYID